MQMPLMFGASTPLIFNWPPALDFWSWKTLPASTRSRSASSLVTSLLDTRAAPQRSSWYSSDTTWFSHARLANRKAFFSFWRVALCSSLSNPLTFFSTAILFRTSEVLSDAYFLSASEAVSACSSKPARTLH